MLDLLPDRIARRIAVVEETGCWLWTGPLNPSGYAYVRADGRQHRVHRLTYELVLGLVPDGLELDHLCRVRHCCNPTHLEAVTKIVNVRRGISANRLKTHCKHGHALVGDNVRPAKKQGRICGRVCVTCQRAYDARWQDKQRALGLAT